MIIYSHGAIIAAGRLGKDAVFRVAGAKNSHFCSFAIAAEEYTDESGQRKTRWIDVSTAFELADAARDFKKGDHVIAAGTLKERHWTDRDGNNRISREMDADYVNKSGAALSSLGALAAKYPGVVTEGVPDPVDSAFANLDDGDGELPF